MVPARVAGGVCFCFCFCACVCDLSPVCFLCKKLRARETCAASRFSPTDLGELFNRTSGHTGVSPLPTQKQSRPLCVTLMHPQWLRRGPFCESISINIYKSACGNLRPFVSQLGDKYINLFCSDRTHKSERRCKNNLRTVVKFCRRQTEIHIYERGKLMK
jgi:hypothetical protein